MGIRFLDLPSDMLPLNMEVSYPQDVTLIFQAAKIGWGCCKGFMMKPERQELGLYMISNGVSVLCLSSLSFTISS